MVVYFKDWAEIEGNYGSLTPAEKKLKAAVAKGEPCFLGNGKLPDELKDWSKPDKTRHIRADVLRFVLQQKVKHGEMTEAGTRLFGAQITGMLDLTNSTVPTFCGLIACRFENAIAADRPQFHSSVFFDHCNLPALFAAGAKIKGQMSCNGTRFETTNGEALILQEAQIGDSLFLCNVTAASTIDINGAKIAGHLECKGARLEATSGKALNLQGAQIGGCLLLYNVTAARTVDITAATITGELSCNGARFDATKGTALDLQKAQIGGGLFLNNVTAASTIDINAATITGQLSCNGARFEATNGIALNLQRAQISESVILRDISATNTIRIKGATIKGQLECEGARFESQSKKALDLEGAQIGDGFFFREVQAVKGHIDLTATQVGTLADDAASWAKADNLILDGFRYDSIAGRTKPIFSERMAWLEKGDHFIPDEKKPNEKLFFPQPYTQLADTYKRAGHDREARDVRVALAGKLHEQYVKEIKKSLAAPTPHNETLAHLFGRPLILSLHTMDWLFKFVVGYGFKPARSIGWLLGMICILTVLSFATWRTGDFTPNSAPILVSQGWVDVAHEENAAQAWTADGAAGQDWETFNSFAYAADIVIPIVEIGQTSAWAPSPARGAWGWTLWWMRWVFTAAGWIISALGAAAITGVIRRE